MKIPMVLLLLSLFLTGCVSKPDGSTKFDPFGALMRTDKSFNDWMDRRAGFTPEEPAPPRMYQQ